MLLTASPQAGAADVSQGIILALDPTARLLVLEDRTVWSLEMMSSDVSAELEAGDRIEIIYESDKEGVGEISGVFYSASRSQRSKPRCRSSQNCAELPK